MLAWWTALLMVVILCANSMDVSLAVSQGDGSKLTLMEKQIPRHNFVRGKRSDSRELHEVVIAIQKLNLDRLEAEVLHRATPSSSKYQHWLDYEEVSALVRNPQAFEAVKTWLDAEQVTISWISPRQDYIKATTRIQHWETLLHTHFYEYSDLSLPQNKLHGAQKSPAIHRAEAYYLPEHLTSHISAIFNTVQTPPAYSPKFYVQESDQEELGALFRTDMLLVPAEAVHTLRGSRRPAATSSGVTISGYVTVAFLNQYYQIPSNNGSSPYSQSVFETSTEYFAPSDLTKFQDYFQLYVQAAESIGNHATTSCPTTATASKSCDEGNLDIQYIMGVSQVTTSIFWWVAGTTYDPFVLWITTLAGESNPPRSNSISWGATEQVSHSISLGFAVVIGRWFVCL